MARQRTCIGFNALVYLVLLKITQMSIKESTEDKTKSKNENPSEKSSEKNPSKEKTKTDEKIKRSEDMGFFSRIRL